MIVAVPRETKEGERRVALLPAAVQELTAQGHEVLVETHAARGIELGDDAYREAGATIVTARDAWDAELVVKVKEMQPGDLALAPRGVAIFSFHHLVGEPARTRALAERGLTAIAWEMMRDAHGRYPLLAPMSAIAGNMAIDVAEQIQGKLSARVLVLGAGHAGLAAARAARAHGAQVTVLTRSEKTRDAVRALGITAEVVSAAAVEALALEAELVVGAAFTPGEPTPKLLPRTLVRRMRPGALIIDIAIEEGGVAETSRPTSHANPAYVEEGVIHYCVGNMPAARPEEASKAISQAALPYVLDMARDGVGAALTRIPELRSALLLWQGRAALPAIAAEAGLPYTALTATDLAE